MATNCPRIVVAALYRFVSLPDYEELRQPLTDKMVSLDVRGTLLLASEGINGTVAGCRQGIDALLDFLRSDPRLAALEVKTSYCDKVPFKRSRVRLKKEIVTLGVQGIDPQQSVGTYVDPDQWNELLDDPDVVVIDTRNEYEVAIGKFAGATNPQTQSFRQFPDFVDSHLDPAKHTKVAMYCTGGIRCEKSTALLKSRGFKEVYHLRGGILKYLEVVPREDSKWQGDCFVFDGRVAVSHGLEVSEHVMCYACGWPLSREQQEHPDYNPGIHCPRCVQQITDEQKSRFAERQRQLSRGQDSLDCDPASATD